MPDNLFIIDIKEFLVNFYEQFRLWFHSQDFGLFEAFKPYIVKALKNPLATAIALIALFGIPFTLIKIKKTSTEAGKRLDKLIEELDQYEINKPKINLKKKFQKDSVEDSLEEPETLQPFNAVDAENLPCPAGPAGETDLIAETLHQPNERLSTEGLIALAPLYFKDEPTGVEQGPLPASQNVIVEEEEFTSAGEPPKTFSLTGDEEEPDWDQLAERETGIEVPAFSPESKYEEPDLKSEEPESKYEENDFAGLEIQDLQEEMEKTIEKLTRQLSSENSEEAPEVKETYSTPVLSDFKPTEPESFTEDVFDNGNLDEPFQEIDLGPQPHEGLEETEWEEAPGPTKSDSIVTQLKTFQEKLETRFQFKGDSEIQDSNESGDKDSGATTLKPTGTACSLPSKAENRDYQDLLESLILLNNPRKNS